MTPSPDRVSLDDVLLEPGAGKSRMALIVDSSPAHHQLMADILSQQSYGTISAYDGLQALELYEEHNPDIILIDIDLPKLSGIETVSRIKALGQPRYAPVIFVTAVQDDAVLNQCLVAGGDDFLTKPFEPSMLRSKLIALGRPCPCTKSWKTCTATCSVIRKLPNGSLPQRCCPAITPTPICAPCISPHPPSAVMSH